VCGERGVEVVHVSVLALLAEAEHHAAYASAAPAAPAAAPWSSRALADATARAREAAHFAVLWVPDLTYLRAGRFCACGRVNAECIALSG